MPPPTSLRPYRKTIFGSSITACFSALCAAALSSFAGAAPSPLWQEFDAAPLGTAVTLPDFSYSGYRYSQQPIPTVAHQVFDVTAYGAIPDDGVSDATAIQGAVNAAAANGSGVVFFPPGRFHLNTAADAGTPITMNAGNIVWRGSGMGPGGTELFMEQNLEATDPLVLTSTPFMIQVAPSSTSEGTAATVNASATRGSFSVQVTSTSNLSVGQWVTLAMTSTAAVDSFLPSPFSASPLWTDLTDTGIVVREKHQIASISGNTVTFVQPLQVDVDVTFGWTLRRYTTMQEIGFEDVAFVGNWKGDFVHHRSPLDDGGWSGLSLNRIVNGWIRRCRFTDWNYTIFMESCSNFTLLHCIFDGTPGHHTVHTRRGYGVLMALSSDRAKHWHSWGMGYQSHSTVIWRSDYDADSTWDSHSGQPYATLLDVVTGGMKYGRSGGPLDSMPNHMGKFTMWNFRQVGTAISNYDFWRSTGSRNLFLRPIVVGFHGAASTFDATKLEAIESMGTPVEPESLFEAQLAKRLGSLPPWVDEAKQQWEIIKNGTPQPTLAAPAKNTVFAPGDAITLAATVPAGEDSLVKRMEFLQDGALLGQDASSPFEYTWNGVAAGTYALQARVVDLTDATALGGKSVVYVGTLPQPALTPMATTASAEDGVNIAVNVLDDDLGTRWSAQGNGSWIQLDLGSVQPVNRVDIAWYLGNTRTSDFEVQLSDDGSAWRTALDLERSSGATLGYQTHYFVGGPARHVRIVGYGNSVNAWNSITELRLYGPAGAAASVGDEWVIFGELP